MHGVGMFLVGTFGAQQVHLYQLNNLTVTTQKSTHQKYQIQNFSQNFYVMMSVMYGNPT
jgi:hypothetical protein